MFPDWSLNYRRTYILHPTPSLLPLSNSQAIISWIKINCYHPWGLSCEITCICRRPNINVINDPKCNKVLNVITFCPKCNKLVITKFSRMGSLPHFLTHGAPQARFARQSSAITFCTLVTLYRTCKIAKDTFRIVLYVTTFYMQHCAVACFVLKQWFVYDCTYVADMYNFVCYWKTVSLYCGLINLNAV